MKEGDLDSSPIARLGRELHVAQQALREPAAGAIGNLECRVADLQERLLSTPARSLNDVATRLEVARDIVRSLGPRGYLLDLIEMSIADLRRLTDEKTAASCNAGPTSMIQDPVCVGSLRKEGGD